LKLCVREMAYEDYPPTFLGVYPVTEYWPRTTDDDSWNLAEERVHGQCMSQFHSVKHLSRWSLSYPQRMFTRGQSNDEKIRSQALSHIDSDLGEQIRALTRDAGMIPVDLGRVLDFVVEVFVLSEGCAVDSGLIAVVWRHSLRTGYLAALISLNQGAGQRMVWQSFVGGVLHDIGMLVFLTQQPQIFTSVVDIAQYRGWDLPMVEKQMLGSTHAESGATFLARWGVDEVLLTIVAFHDDPLQVPHSAFGPLTAVYAANLVDGGGMAQDADGVIGKEGEAYLTRLGLWNNLPLWQGWMRNIHQLVIQ
jgi:hypothetical protein